MPRTSRSVAQRLASQKSSKKRRAPRTGTPSPAESPASAPPPAGSSVPSVDQILDEVVPSAGGSRAAATPTLAPAPTRSPGATARRAGVGAGRSSAKAPLVRRRYAEYAEEYQYVFSDLRRILIVAGVLIALLVVLSFFLQ